MYTLIPKSYPFDPENLMVGAEPQSCFSLLKKVILDFGGFMILFLSDPISICIKTGI
jgi:hypothetical protein